jgi:hypothetical protein
MNASTPIAIGEFGPFPLEKEKCCINGLGNPQYNRLPIACSIQGILKVAIALFAVIYACVVGENVCIESHYRLRDELQHTLSRERCTSEYSNLRLGNTVSSHRAYCQYEKEGPDYSLTYDFVNNTIQYKLSR